MAWKTSDNAALGVPAFNPAAADATPQTIIGAIVEAFDDVFGQGEFIYLPGVAATAAGDLVSYDQIPGAIITTRAVTGAGITNSGRPLAVALNAILANQYGWYQISGVAIVNIAGAGVVGPLFTTATAGSGSSAVTAGAQVLGARISTAVGVPAAGKSYVTIQRPCMQGQIT